MEAMNSDGTNPTQSAMTSQRLTICFRINDPGLLSTSSVGNGLVIDDGS